MLTYGLTSDKRIARVPRGTPANGIVIYDLASSAKAACSGAWISTLLVATSLVLWTLGTDHALGSARGRASDEALHARAHCLSVDLPTLTVGSTG